MRFASWNLRYCGTDGARSRVHFLNRLDWDVLALQEVSRHAWDVITDSGFADSSAYALEVFDLGHYASGITGPPCWHVTAFGSRIRG